MGIRVVVAEKGASAVEHLYDQAEITIGRVQGNDLVLPKGNLSKRHTRVVLRDGKLIVVDLKSTNGTFVNGKRVSSPQVLKDDDRVYVGDFTLAFSVTAASGRVATHAPVAAPGGLEDGPTVQVAVAADVPQSSPGRPPPTALAKDLAWLALNDADVAEVKVEGTLLWVTRHGRAPERHKASFSSNDEAALVIGALLKSGGLLLDAAHPVVDGEIARGVRVTGRWFVGEAPSVVFKKGAGGPRTTVSDDDDPVPSGLAQNVRFGGPRRD